ncbi:hypothetical protein BVRB_8g186960 [Beta vulgaris subsp. vulgaris]|nr:hypothetical protein BVRB_8g186960 [Beta vulgaris subsp. vulgaris]
MEYGWTAWLTASMELDVVKRYKLESVRLVKAKVT